MEQVGFRMNDFNGASRFQDEQFQFCLPFCILLRRGAFRNFISVATKHGAINVTEFKYRCVCVCVGGCGWVWV